MIFAEPLFLWGLLAIALPIVVHLFNFRRYKKVYFSNVERLIEVKSEKRKVKQLRRWLVLLMRCLAIVFLVFAFARPMLPGKGQKVRSGATVVSVFVDNSFSMENSSTEGSQLETAKQKAREIVAAHHQDDRYQLLTNDMKGEEFRWLSRDEFLDAVDELRISPASRPLKEVIARQRDFMSSSAAPNRYGYVVSDFQTSVSDLSDLPSDSLASFTLVPLEAVAADNLFIDTLTLDAPAYFVGGSVEVEVTVRNEGGSAIEKLPVKLFVGERERAIATLDLPAGASGKALLRFTIDAPGWIDGRVEISDHPVVFDDSYYFTLHAGEPVRVLEIDGGKPNPFLQKLFAADSAIRLSNATLEDQFQEYDMIVLNEAVDIPSGRAQGLAAWVEAGGTLVVVPPAEGQFSTLNEMLSMLQAPKLEGWNRRPVKASQVDLGSRLYRNVFAGKNEEMEMPSVQGHYTLSGNQAVKQSVISFPDASDLLSLTSHGSGAVYLFSVPLTAEWTELVSQALFVPTLYNMALYSRPLPPVAYRLGGTEPIFLTGSYNPADTPPELTSMTDEGFAAVLPDIRRVGSRSVMVPHGEASTAGIYRIADEHLAFNFDRRESQLDFLTRGDVEKAFAGLEGYKVVRNSAKPLDRQLIDSAGGISLWRWCILLALLALMGEILLIKRDRHVAGNK